MTTELLAPLVLLAVVDSTSFGTLLIPLWLMLAPGRPRPGRILLFLGTVAAFYLMLGMALLLGASTLLTMVQETSSQTLRIAQLFAGVGLMVVGGLMEPWTKAGKEHRIAGRAHKKARSGPSLQRRVLMRLADASAPASATVGLALTAVVIEAASMIPYLAAIGLLSASELSLTGRGAVLFGYCMLMIAPALVLLAARLWLHGHVAPVLDKLEEILSRNANEAMAWVMFVLGLYMVGDSISALS